MTDKMKVKIIKKDAVKAVETIAAIEDTAKSNPGREIVSTVTNWVADFKKRKRNETKSAIDKFLTPHPTRCES